MLTAAFADSVALPRRLAISFATSVVVFSISLFHVWPAQVQARDAALAIDFAPGTDTIQIAEPRTLATMDVLVQVLSDYSSVASFGLDLTGKLPAHCANSNCPERALLRERADAIGNAALRRVRFINGAGLHDRLAWRSNIGSEASNGLRFDSIGLSIRIAAAPLSSNALQCPASILLHDPRLKGLFPEGAAPEIVLRPSDHARVTSAARLILRPLNGTMPGLINARMDRGNGVRHDLKISTDGGSIEMVGLDGGPLRVSFATGLAMNSASRMLGDTLLDWDLGATTDPATACDITLDVSAAETVKP